MPIAWFVLGDLAGQFPKAHHDKERDNNHCGQNAMFHFSVSFCGPGNQHVGSEPDAEPVPGANSDVGQAIQETIQDARSGLAESLACIGAEARHGALRSTSVSW